MVKPHNRRKEFQTMLYFVHNQCWKSITDCKLWFIVRNNLVFSCWPMLCYATSHLFFTVWSVNDENFNVLMSSPDYRKLCLFQDRGCCNHQMYYLYVLCNQHGWQIADKKDDRSVQTVNWTEIDDAITVCHHVTCIKCCTEMSHSFDLHTEPFNAISPLPLFPSSSLSLYLSVFQSLCPLPG